jgi:hypothetical protein
MKRRLSLAGLICVLATAQVLPCTIISGRARDGAVWAGNNEDWAFDFDTYLNVLPREGKRLGAISFTYDSPNSAIQGGVNEAGLFFDYNAVPGVPTSAYEGWDKKRDFPGADAIADYVLRNCATVLEALEVFKQYRDPGLLESQMHLADRQGNLAIVNADSVRLTRSSAQITTNFNACTKAESAEARACWRFPIAERMLKARGVSLDSFRDILDATQQPRFVSTIYANIVNLATLDLYLYYAGDFQHAAQFKIADLLAQGKKSYLMRALFAEAPVVRVWDAYQSQGAQAALQLFRGLQGDLPEKRRSEALRHIFSSILFGTNPTRPRNYADAVAFFDEWAKACGDHDAAANFYGALVRLANGDYDQARRLLTEQVKIDATDEMAQRVYPGKAARLLARLEGRATPGANVRFELKGHADAKFVALWLPDKSAVYAPLVKTADGWAGDFVMPAGKVYYGFMVDGRMILDPANPDTDTHTADDGSYRMSVKVVR